MPAGDPRRSAFSPSVRETLDTADPPVKERTDSSPSETVDPDRLLAAWKMQAATMREVVRVIEINEDNNARVRRSNWVTQMVVLGALAATLSATVYATYEARRAVTAVTRIEGVAQTAGTEIRESMRVVAVAVASLNEVEMLEKDAAEASKPVVTRAARRAPALVTMETPNRPTEQTQALTRARMRSMAKSLEAQARFASDASVAVQVEARTRKLRERAAEKGVELDAL